MLPSRRPLLSALIALVVLFVSIVSIPGQTALAASEGGAERIAVLPFWAVDEEGRIVPRSSESDLARLLTVVPQAITARLVQSGAFGVDDRTTLEMLGQMPEDGVLELDRVAALLSSDQFDQVITGTIAQVEKSIVVNVRRYVRGAEGPEMVGAVVSRANAPNEVVTTVDRLLTQLFPPEAEVVNSPIARIAVVPSVLRIPVGSVASFNAIAIDEFGRTLPTVELLYQTEDESRATVDAHGNVTGVSPGRVKINVQPLGSPLVGGTPPTVEVNVVGPNLGMRVGASVSSSSGTRPRFGLRLTPGSDIQPAAQSPARELERPDVNPMNFLTSFFSSLLGNGLLSLDLDVVPGQDLTVTLDAVQRTMGSYFGTGIGVAVPMAEGAPSGINLRLSIGTNLPFNVRKNMTIPFEMNVDFLVGGAESKPSARFGASVGIDLFQ